MITEVIKQKIKIFNNFFYTSKLLRNIDIILLDQNYSKIKLDNEKKVVAYKIGNKTNLNLKILFKSFFIFIFNRKKLKLSEIYFIEFIKHTNPIVGIGDEISGYILKFKKFFPKKISIMYQIADYSNFYKETAPQLISHNRNYNLDIDYLLCKNEFSTNFLNFIPSKKIITGSIKNNELGIIDNAKKKYDLLFVSEFRKTVKSYFGTNNNIGALTTAEAATSFLLKILNKYSTSKKKSVCLGLVSNRDDKQKYFKNNKNYKKDEISFFSRDLKNFYTENINTYELSFKSNLTIAMRSTIGLELLSRGQKVLILDPRAFLGGHPIKNISNSEEGLFWYFGQNEEKIIDKIESISKIGNLEWINELNKFETIMFDPNNKKLKNLLNDLILASNEK